VVAGAARHVARVDEPLVALHGFGLLARGGVPQAQRRVRGARHEVVPVRGPAQVQNGVLVPAAHHEVLPWVDGSGRGARGAARMGRRRNRETGMVRRRRADGTGPSSWTAREKKSAFAIDRRAPGWTYLALAAHVPQVQRLVRARGRHRGAVGGELHARHRVLVALQQHDGRVEGRRPLVRPGLELLPQRGLRHSQRRGAPLAGLLLLRDEAELGILGRGRRGGFTLARHRAVGSGDDPPRFLGLSRTTHTLVGGAAVRLFHLHDASGGPFALSFPLPFTRGGTQGMPKGHQAHRKHASKGTSAGASKRDGKRGGFKVRPASRAPHRGHTRETARHRISSSRFSVSPIVARRLAA
jgi:hypothetical protein